MVQWIPINKEEKETWVITAGKFHGWIQRLALVDPFLGSPLLTSLSGLGVIQVPQWLDSR